MPASQPVDSDKNIEYYEAIIQLRPYNEKVFDYVVNQFKKSPNAWISKLEELKTGVDVYVSSWRTGLSVGKKLKKVFGGSLVTSRALYATDHMTSKRVYRVSICFRLKEKE